MASYRQYITAITAMDFSAAFDLVDLVWLTDFLNDRTQMANVNGTNSQISLRGSVKKKCQSMVFCQPGGGGDPPKPTSDFDFFFFIKEN